MSDVEEIAAFVEARLTEEEHWAVEASRDIETGPIEGGATWQWEDTSTDHALTPRLEDCHPDETGTLPTLDVFRDGDWHHVSLRSAQVAVIDIGRFLPQFAIGEAQDVPVAVAGHITRWDPARVLREIEAKRGRLRLLRVAENRWNDLRNDHEPFNAFERGDSCGRYHVARRMVVLDAQTWREHADYRPEWEQP